MRKSALKKVGSKGATHLKLHALWRQLVLDRDDWTCRRCGTILGVLQAHHIYPKKVRPKMRYMVDNGVALCQPCHFWIERIATTFEAHQWYREHISNELLAALDLLSRDRSKVKTDLKLTELWLRSELAK